MPRSCSIYSFHEHVSGLPQHQQPKIRSPPHLQRSVFVVTLCHLSFILLCVLSAVVSGAELSPGWVSWRYPNPRSNPDGCGWTDVVQWAGDSIRNISWICDPDHLLGYGEAYDLALRLENYHQESPCDCPQNCSRDDGYQIGIALVDRLNTDGEFEPMKVKAKNFADDVRVTWFADHGCDDNVLIFYGYYDDELYISIGETTQQVISDLELVGLTERGDRYITGQPVTQPPPQDGAQPPSNQTVTVVPTTTDSGARKTSTYAGLVPLVDDVQKAITNGQSISSQIVYAIAVPIILVLMIIIMCLMANWWCRPDYGYHQPEERPLRKTDDDEDEDYDDEEEEEELKVEKEGDKEDKGDDQGNVDVEKGQHVKKVEVEEVKEKDNEV